MFPQSLFQEACPDPASPHAQALLGIRSYGYCLVWDWPLCCGPVFVDATFMVLYSSHTDFSSTDSSHPATTCDTGATLQVNGTTSKWHGEVCLPPGLELLPQRAKLEWGRQPREPCSGKAPCPGLWWPGLLLPRPSPPGLLTSRTRQLWELRSRWMMFMEWR